MHSPAHTATLAPRTVPRATPRVAPTELRRVLSHFCSGVTIVTGRTAATDPAGGETPVGFTCQSFTSLSLDPPLVALAVARTSSTWPRIEPSGAFCVNILASGQEALCRTFAVSGADKFAGVDWAPGPATGSPVLAGSLAWADCTVDAVLPGGDHWIVIGRVGALEAAEPATDPLLFFRSGFHRPAA
ncbi:flavin reductase family protein [Streptomyces monticola]|uniref:Flavin reductase family protein n=1 Tax=Streptomyces monticola TaxID=2666263 RepID=A0ABW2JVP5_9ACTN